MIENPIVEALFLIVFGMCIGIQLFQWYLIRVGKNTVLKCIELIGIKAKKSEITLKKIFLVINKIVTEMTVEIENNESKERFKKRNNKKS